MTETKKLDRRDVLHFLGSAAVLGCAGAVAPLVGCQGPAVKADGTEVAGGARLNVSESANVGIGLHASFFQHSLTGHPENHLRIQAILASLAEDQFSKRLGALRLLPSRNANVDELLLAHERTYIEKVQRLTGAGSYMTKSKWSPYGGPMAYAAAAASAATAIDIVQAVDGRQIKSGFALSRPPGHHAGRDSAAGYCFFNNVVVAVRALQSRKKVRVAIYDFDVHHGNGIQDAFFQDSQVLYISTHQDGWPGTGTIEKIGAGAGRGMNINIPLPMGTADKGFAAVFRSLVEPALRRYKPDIIVGAAGFDTHWRDYQGGLALSSSGQAAVVQNLKRVAGEVCGGRLALVLEGGYQLEVLATGVSNAMQVLTADVDKQPIVEDTLGFSEQSEPAIDDIVAKVSKLHGLI